MKKNILIFFIILFSFYTFSNANEYKILSNTSTYDGDGYLTNMVLKENTIVTINDLNCINTQNNSEIPFNFGIYVNRSGHTVLIDINKVIPKDTTDLFESDIISYNLELQGKSWIPKTELEILHSNTRDTYYQLHSKQINNYEKNIRGSNDNPWYKDIYSNKGEINNLFLLLYDGIKYHFVLKIQNIRKEKNGYYINTEVSDVLIDDSDYKNSVLDELSRSEYINLFFIIDGDYLFINSEKKELLFTYVLADNNIQKQYEKLIHDGKTDISNISWPRHADGTCDYEDVSSVKSVSTPSTNVAKNKTMLVSENLKLRSAEATTSQVLTVMQAGTKVKILELGKAENIDGINSNWVKVEVQPDAKDRDGKPIKAGTVGWCFGGYLK